jgi:hypothetical protein
MGVVAGLLKRRQPVSEWPSKRRRQPADFSAAVRVAGGAAKQVRRFGTRKERETRASQRKSGECIGDRRLEGDNDR